MKDNYISKVDKEFEILEFAKKQLLARKIERIENGFIINGTYSSLTDGFKIYTKDLTGTDHDVVVDDRFIEINSKHQPYMKYGATQFLMLIYGLNKEQAKNKALNLIQNDYEDEAEQEECILEKMPYVYINRHGNQSVNTSLLAEYIRQNNHYYIVKKQGSDSFFIYWYEDGYYKELSPNELKAKIKALIPLEIRKPSFWEDTYKDLVATDNFISYEQMNTDTYYINFPNGILDTRTWE